MLTFIAVIVVAYAAIAGFLYVFQRSFVFLPGGTLVAPAEAGLHSVEVVTIAMADATLLTGWYAEPQAGQPSVLYFHGNGGNISMRADYFRHILGSGFGLLAMSYRGYPGSGGSPSEEALLADGLELFDWLAARVGTIVIYGESLGSAVGIYVAAEREAGAVILEAPFTAAVDIARGAYPWLPVGLLMHDPFLSRERIGRVEEPVLIVHGADDRIVPAKHGRRLFAMAGEPKRLEVFEAAGHEDLWGRGLWPVALDFLQEHGVAAQPAP